MVSKMQLIYKGDVMITEGSEIRNIHTGEKTTVVRIEKLEYPPKPLGINVYVFDDGTKCNETNIGHWEEITRETI